ncbi:MAG TPA: response regulator transcription factor [Euryarchaeota archaeon]|nr:transcriptional regulatory protein AfsQ1 [archaeon]HEQ78323.1 response regulator transcription factor [Euryarchaeota archaeon]
MAKILTIDDEPGINDLLKIMLKKRGHETIQALSGEEGIEILKKEKVDLVLLDVMMFGIDGWETLRRIRENEATKDMPVIMVTVRGAEIDKEESFSKKADAHITKPIVMEQLLRTVDWVLKQAKRRSTA